MSPTPTNQQLRPGAGDRGRYESPDTRQRPAENTGTADSAATPAALHLQSNSADRYVASFYVSQCQPAREMAGDVAVPPRHHDIVIRIDDPDENDDDDKKHEIIAATRHEDDYDDGVTSVQSVDEEIYFQSSSSSASNASSTGQLMTAASAPAMLTPHNKHPPLSLSPSAAALPPSSATIGKCDSPTPSFTFADVKAARLASRGRQRAPCRSHVVLKVTLTFSLSFLLAMVATVVYIELCLWKHRT